MKRRKFFQLTSLSVAGVGLAGSCSNPKTKTAASEKGEQTSYNVPAYKKTLGVT